MVRMLICTIIFVVDISRDFWPIQRDHTKAIEGINIGLSHKGFQVGAKFDL